MPVENLWETREILRRFAFLAGLVLNQDVLWI
jgi:hypothetical protein